MEARRYIPRYTAADYEQWEGSWELWDGVPVAMTPSPGFRHQSLGVSLVRQIGDELDRRDACDCRVVYETDWRIAEDQIVCPDVAVCCPGDEPDWIRTPPLLIVEILSPSTAFKDRSAKRALYESQGVRTYVMADPATRSLEVLTLGDAGAYGDVPVADDRVTLAVREGCSIELRVSDLWT